MPDNETGDATNSSASKAAVNSANTKDEIKSYLDDQGIEYKSSDTKAQLLNRVEDS